MTKALVHVETASVELPSENFVSEQSMTESHLKKLTSEPEELSKVDVVAYASIKKGGVHECSAYSQE